MPDLRVTDHALARYAEHYPGSFEAGLLEALEHSREIPAAEAQPLRGMGAVRDSDTGTFHLHENRTGMFVVERGVVVTYLRFGARQRETAIRIYGPPGHRLPPPSGHASLFGCPVENLQRTNAVAKALGPHWRLTVKHSKIEDYTGNFPNAIGRFTAGTVYGHRMSFLLIRKAETVRVIVDAEQGAGRYRLSCPICCCSSMGCTSSTDTSAAFDCGDCGANFRITHPDGLKALERA